MASVKVELLFVKLPTMTPLCGTPMNRPSFLSPQRPLSSYHFWKVPDTMMFCL